MTSSTSPSTETISVMSALVRIKDHLDKAQAEFDQLSNEVKQSALEFHNEDSSLNHCLRWGVTAVDELIEELDSPKEAPIFGYYIDVDERGSFLADVRDQEGKVLFEIASGDCLQDDASSIFEDGFMKDRTDLGGLTTYLKSLGVIPENGKILSMSEFEKEEEPRPRFRA